MKLFKYILPCLVFITYILILPSFAGRSIAVVKGKYDHVEKALKAYRISFDTISLKDCEIPGKIGKYSSIFLPSGLDKPLEEFIKVRAHRKNIESVNIEDNFIPIDRERVRGNISGFIKSGGAVYFSGFAFEYVPDNESFFKYHKDFPWAGMEGRIKAELYGNLSTYCGKETFALYINYTGWVALKAIENGKVLSKGSFQTPFGTSNGPLSASFNWGSGSFIYTSTYTSVYSLYRRFHVYQVAGAPLITRLRMEQSLFGEKEIVTIVDAIHNKEPLREYSFTAKPGIVTVYLLSNRDHFQIDLLDSNRRIIYSDDSSRKKRIFVLENRIKKDYILRVFPLQKRYGLFAIVCTEKSLRYPYYFLGAILLLLAIVSGLFFYRKYK